MREPDLAKALAVIMKPIIKEAVREAMSSTDRGTTQKVNGNKPFLTVKRAAEASGLGVSTIRPCIRKRQLRAQQVGRRVLVKSNDLGKFLETSPIEAKPD